MNCQNEFEPRQLKQFFSQLSQQNLLIVGNFLDIQDIQNVLQALQKYVTDEIMPTKSMICLKVFVKSLFVKKFLARNLNAMDKSTYISLYQNSSFLSTEKQKLAILQLNEYEKYKEIQITFNNMQNGLIQEFSSIVEIDCSEISEIIFSNMTEPFPPSPHLRRDNIGMYCNSSFQFYLIDKRFLNKDSEQFLELTFQEIKQGLMNLRQKELSQNVFLQNLNTNQNIKKIHYLFQYWYQISRQNYQEYLILDNKQTYSSKIHNSLIYLIVLFDTFIESINIYLSHLIDDPYYQFVEFILRYSVFRNTILELEKQIQFLFAQYNNIYYQFIEKLNYDEEKMQIEDQGERKTQKIKISFWHCLLSKWYLHMSKYHAQFNSIYCLLLKKANFQMFKQNFEQEHVAIGEHTMYKFIIIFRCLENYLFEEEDSLLKSQKKQPLQSSILKLMKEQNLIHQLLKEYLQYLVDISINQDSVHWCGHSEHQMHIPYQEHEQKVLEEFTQYLQKIYHICFNIDPKNILFLNIANKIFYQLDKQFIKPVTLSKLVNYINQQWGEQIQQKALNLSPKTPKTPKLLNTSAYFKLFESFEQFKQYCAEPIKIIDIDFNLRDKKLQYFNTSSQIPRQFDYSYNIVIQTQDFNNSLKRSANTNCSISEDHNDIKQVQKSISTEFALLHKIVSFENDEIEIQI